ncbi:sugar phosphate isomerase/epimerase family protein [Asaia spathodeae]|uniref:Sugar phosphate isomerase/epimerase n=1 Tax=Asaia spathodeae TaxID=657016 RepID=A0ABX2P2G7_9PROT|nr:sugar phosphate isomerase/epimerase family protein [Asaia spathodeae]GBR17784.1 4-hydroxyphenylpyruvate dioxygenase [Asaia spathodeae NBRC 105894]
MTDFPFRFGVNQFTTQPWSFKEDVARYAALEVDAIEICEAKLDPAHAGQQMLAAREAGLSISAVQPKIRTFFGSKMAPQPESVEERVAAFAQSLKTLAPHAEGASFVMNTGAPPDGNMQRCLDETVHHLRRLAPLAADLGVTIAMEPLNPTSINVETAIWTVDQALDLLDAVGHASCGLCLDYWNIWQQPDCAASIRRAGERIFVLQASDWRTPCSGMDRLVPGSGSIPLGALLHATYDAGYRGVCTLEIFSSGVPDSLYDQDLSEVVHHGRLGLMRAWSGYGKQR